MGAALAAGVRRAGVPGAVSVDAGLSAARAIPRVFDTRSGGRRRAPHLSHRRICRRAGVAAARNAADLSHARLHLPAHHRAVSARRLGLAQRHPANAASGPDVLDRRRGHRQRRGLDHPRLSQGRLVHRSLRHHSAGAGLCRSHHRHRQPRKRQEMARLGRAAGADGLHQLPDAIVDLQFDILRLRPRAVRPSRRRYRARHRHRRLRRAGIFQRDGGCAVTATARSNGCGAR